MDCMVRRQEVGNLFSRDLSITGQGCKTSNEKGSLQFYSTGAIIHIRTDPLHHQHEAINWMKKKEYQTDQKGVGSGGILADDMGLGKTLDCISIIIQYHNNTLIPEGEDSAPPQGQRMFTLIVVPLSLLLQWKEEIIKHTDCSEDDVLIYHGTGRKGSLDKFTGIVVITTYDIVRKEFVNRFEPKNRPRNSKKAKFTGKVLFDIVWFRIILDEAHKIRTQLNSTTRAVCRLSSKRRWCVTGTPFNNRLEDLKSLAEFIGIEPYNSNYWWTNHSIDDMALKEWRKCFILVRTKFSVLNLPPINYEVIQVEFSPEESQFYGKLYADALSLYSEFKAMSGTRKSRLFGTMLSWLIRLRQACIHPLLLLGRAWTRPYAEKSMAGNLYVREICCQCKESISDMAESRYSVLSCGHYICALCEGDCQLCQMASPWLGEETVTIDKKETSRDKAGKRKRHKQIAPTRRYKSSSKFKAICEWCKTSLEQDPQNKVVLFSQWTSCLDLVEYFLREEYGIQVFRFDGDIPTINERNNIVRKFSNSTEDTTSSTSIGPPGLIFKFLSKIKASQDESPPTIERPKGVDGQGKSSIHSTHLIKEEPNLLRSVPPSCRVMLLSLQCGGLGLNLISANRVGFIDPWYNPFFEQQAIDRVHRIGQTNPVTVVRFRVNKSIEMDIARIQEKKKLAATNILSGSGHSGSTSATNDPTNFSSLVDQNSGLSEQDVHEIFKRASNILFCEKKH